MTVSHTLKFSCILTAALLALLPVTPAQAQALECTAGFAGPYPCKDVNLQAIVESSALSTAVCGRGGTGSDIWGWTDPATGREYALQGLSDATVFVDVTEPTSPTFVGCLPAPANNFLWRDVKVQDNHAYVVGDFSPLSTDDSNPDAVHGLQIFDLARLRNVAGPVAFDADAVYTGFDEAHNLATNEETGFLYVGASDTCGGGLHMLDLRDDPADPQFAGCFDDNGINVHDAHCVVYRGPDSDYQGREICVNSNEDFLDIVDVTDKSAPYRISRSTSVGQSYVHQGWFTEDQRYFLLGDETDELDSFTAGNPHNTWTYLWDFSDLDNPVQMETYVGPTAAIDHNLYVRGNLMFQSNYTAGLRIIDISDIANANLEEIAFFDTDPPNADVPAFAGLWSSYVYFESGTVVSSQLEGGQLFVLQPTNLPEPPPAGDGNDEFRITGGGWLASGSGGKLNFNVTAGDDGNGPEGKFKLKDKDAGVRIKSDNLTYVGSVQGICGSISDSNNAIEVRGSGKFNGTNASFRVCAVDNGEPGRDADRFHLECTAGCNYSSADRSVDDTIDGGNLQVRRPASPANSADGENEATTLILDPLLIEDVTHGATLSFSAQLFDRDQTAMAGQAVSLTTIDANGVLANLQAVTDSTGTATFILTPPPGAIELGATSGTAESNRIPLHIH